jgi:signal transduction histidine kinase
MRWHLPVLGTLGVALWIDALLGGDLAASTGCLVVVACFGFLAGWSSSRLPELVLTAVVVAALLTVADQATATEFSLANDGVFYTVVVLGPSVVGWLLGTRTRQLGEIRRRTVELERLRDATLAAARVREAERVEREIDLALAERLDKIVADVREADRRADSDPGAVPRLLARVEATAREALAELRTVLGVLLPEPTGPVSAPPQPAGKHAPAASRGAPRPWGWPDLLLLLSTVPLLVETSQADGHGPGWLNLAACLGQGLALCVVRRRTLSGTVILFTLASVQTMWLTPLPSTVSWALPGLLVSFLVGRAARRRTAVAGLSLALLGFGAVTLATPAEHQSLDGIVPSIAMIVLAWCGGRSLAVREGRARQLRWVVDELARVREEQVRQAVFDQRAEMARELHDVGAHVLTVVCLQVAAAQKLWDRDQRQARAALAAVRELADRSLAHLGESLGGLVADDVEGPLEPAALAVLAGLGRTLGLDVTLEVAGEPYELDGPAARATIRLVQEAITNSARYAPSATVRVSLVYATDALEVHVSDSGPGRVPTTSPPQLNGAGLGLRGMRERVESCQGVLSYGSTESGFAIHARLPRAPSPTRTVS